MGLALAAAALYLLSLAPLCGGEVQTTAITTSNDAAGTTSWNFERTPSNPNLPCKRLVSFLVKEEGESMISDGIENLLLALVVAKRTRSTLVLPETFRFNVKPSRAVNGSSINAQRKLAASTNHHHIFYSLLGVPQGLPFMDSIKYEGLPKIVSRVEQLLYNPSHINDYKCNELLSINIGSCGVSSSSLSSSLSSSSSSSSSSPSSTESCLWKHGDVIHAAAKPIILHSRSRAPDKCETGVEAIKASAINIVWYIRTGQLCSTTCGEGDYVKRVWTFIEATVRDRSFKNIIIIQKDPKSGKSFEERADAVKKELPNSSVLSFPEHSREEICLLLRSDLLVTTGSAFVNSIMQFTDYGKPVVIADHPEGWFESKKKPALCCEPVTPPQPDELPVLQAAPDMVYGSRLARRQGLLLAYNKGHQKVHRQQLIMPTAYQNAQQCTSSSSSSSSAKPMKDEYSSLDSLGDTHTIGTFKLENGVVIDGLQVRYSTYGKLNKSKDNVVVVCHALTGNSRLDQWWGPLLGPGLAMNTDKYFIVCANVLGSCYGTTGPSSINPKTGKKYNNDFPDVTIRDTVGSQIDLLKIGLGIKGVKCVIGGSMGGMQTLEWLVLGRDIVKSAVVIACGAAHTAWQIAISETQRQAIYADPLWNNGNIDESRPPSRGLAAARQVAMIWYRTSHAYELKFSREKDNKSNEYQVKNYLEYQGKKFIGRFDATTYVKLTAQMDTHDVGRGRDGIEAALGGIDKNVLVMGIDSDILYPLHEQQNLAKMIKNSEFKVISSDEGHDAFLLEQKQVSESITAFLDKIE